MNQRTIATVTALLLLNAVLSEASGHLLKGMKLRTMQTELGERHRNLVNSAYNEPSNGNNKFVVVKATASAQHQRPAILLPSEMGNFVIEQSHDPRVGRIKSFV